MKRLRLSTSLSFLAGLMLLAAPAARAADPFADKVVPFLSAYCVQCHNPKKAGGELDLTKFTTVAKSAEDFRQWEHIIGFLKKEEMPPEKAKQPTAALRADIVSTVEAVLFAEARKQAGDPGVVHPRRLSNAEYDYTVHDLTGVDIRPAATFPVDPSSGEGFTNTGEALTMSPSLFKKYYAAAEFVADHAVLTSSGLTFAPHAAVAFADRQKFYEQQIIRFYESHAVDLEKYLTAAWSYRHLPAARKAASIEEWAAEQKLSPKYLRSLWETLQGDPSADRFVLGWLRTRWNALPETNGGELQAGLRTLATDIRRLSKQLCAKESEAIVSNAGNGPVEHLARRRQTAASRDQFDLIAMQSPRFTREFPITPDKPTLKLVVQVADADGIMADGNVILNGTFTTNNQTTDNKRRWTLRAILAEHAPDQLAKLKFDADTLTLTAPSVLELDIPTTAFPLSKGKGSVTFTADCRLDRSTQGIAVLRLLDRVPSKDDKPEAAHPLLDPKHAVARQFEASASQFCKLFPNRFVYVDDTRGLSAGFHLIEGFFRDDQPLYKSVLNDAEKREIDRLWSELYFVTGIWEKMLRGFVFFERSERNFLKHRDFDEFKEEDPFLTNDDVLAKFQEVYLKRANVKATGDDLAKHPITIFFEDIRAGLKRRTETFSKAEPIYRDNLLAFAARAYSRPLTDAERAKIESFYRDLCRHKDHGVEAAVRASITRILVSPHFCYHFDPAPPGDSVAPLPDLALASRLSYFLWASQPDEELLALAKTGKLKDERILREQVRRMVKDPKVSRFAREFFGQWFGYRDFLTQEAVNRQVFPQFDDALKLAMFEEPTRLATDLIQRNRPITELLDSDATFVNKRLAQHYNVPFAGTDDWQRVEGLHDRGRGGVLGMAVFLTKNSQPQRTSPVKRGFWVVHKLLGEHIPPPPANVAVLPTKETDTNGKTIRQLLALHTTEAHCARCHQRFDPVGLAMEGFDPIGRVRTKDLAGRVVDNLVSLPSGKTARGVPEFAQYLTAQRKADFTRTLGQKFLGYALGRSLQLSDQPLLQAMQTELKSHDDHLSTLFELVATSPQFRNQRCRDFTPEKFRAELPTPR